ncbi:MAG: alpha/beta fold hydrolase [Deltaproteobacteria bacterium]|nr:alpha/beta fold hydrolase [Deltaproteobacteria bacterium]
MAVAAKILAENIPRYRSPWWLPSGHLQTVYPVLLRRLPLPPYQRQRLELPDGDFLDLDWLRQGNDRLVIISHGLEGHSRRPYVVGMARLAVAAGWDALAWNFRGCGGDSNRLPRLYCNADTEDLHAVVSCAAARGYSRIALVGFSMGGNVTLLYLGGERHRFPAAVAGAVVFSVPCDLKGCAAALARPECRIYMRRFLADLRAKLEIKQRHFPALVRLDGYENIRDFRDFDNRYTAPFHGFADAEDYWRRCSCLPYLEAIRLPSLLINAANDPFLSPSCFPSSLENPQVGLVVPEQGGHCGFPPLGNGGRYWSEEAVARFLAAL